MREIKKISDVFSEGVQHEVEAVSVKNEQYDKWLDKAATAEAYYSNPETSSVAVTEYRSLVKTLNFPDSGFKILDIGAGLGQSSVFLASLGHEVHVLEPVRAFCEVINKAAEKYDLNISVYEGVAEDAAAIGADSDFDVIFFNASLHHCDDPDTSVKNAYNLLKRGGRIVLASENFIRPWMTKKKWYYMLEHFPEAMGHYGGNEHVYYNWEYKAFLKRAGFSEIKNIPTAYSLMPIERLELILGKRINNVRMYSEGKVLTRYLFYMMSKSLVKRKFIFNLLSNASIAETSFSATKR